MGYFSNGSEGTDFDERYCSHCINMPVREDAGCPVWHAHLLFAYEECGQKSNAKVILDMLIEPRKDGPQRCAMFIDKRKKVARTQADLDADKVARNKIRPKLVDWPPSEPQEEP
jgi:hypothetical protein